VAELAKKIITPPHLCRALLLAEWPLAEKNPLAKGSPNEMLSTAAEELYKKLEAQAVKTVRAGLVKGDSHQRQVLLVLVGLTVDAGHGDLGQQERQRAMREQERRQTLGRALTKDILAVQRKDPDPAVRRTALATLALFRLPAEQFAPAIGLGLKSKDLHERRAAAGVLLSPFEPQRRLSTTPKDQIDVVRHFAPVATKGVAGDKDAEVRRHCLTFLATAAEQTSRHILDLIPTPLTSPLPVPQPDDDPKEIERFRKWMAERFDEVKPALGPLGRALSKAVARLNDDDLACCLAAHKALEGGATLRHALRRLDESLVPLENKSDRKSLLSAPAKAVPALVKSLGHREVRVRLAALYVLETLTIDAAPSADDLAKALGDDNRFVRWGAARALRNMAPAGAEKSVAALAKALSDDSPDVRNTAAVALARCGRRAKGAVDDLANALRKGDDRLRPLAAKALAALGPDAKPARAALIAALADEKPQVRAAAATALGKTGPLDEKAKAALLRALDDEDGEVQRAAATALLC
jgi:HEAT repeat protein